MTNPINNISLPVVNTTQTYNNISATLPEALDGLNKLVSWTGKALIEASERMAPKLKDPVLHQTIQEITSSKSSGILQHVLKYAVLVASLWDRKSGYLSKIVKSFALGSIVYQDLKHLAIIKQGAEENKKLHATNEKLTICLSKAEDNRELLIQQVSKIDKKIESKDEEIHHSVLETELLMEKISKSLTHRIERISALADQKLRTQQKSKNRLGMNSPPKEPVKMIQTSSHSSLQKVRVSC